MAVAAQLDWGHSGVVPTFSRPPCAALAPWVQLLWASDVLRDDTVGDLGGTYGAAPLERVLPTGAKHVVLRLTGEPLVLFDDEGGLRPHVVGTAVVGGVRASRYVKRGGDKAVTVGVQLRPGAALALLGVPASELAECHTPLELVWGRDSVALRDRLRDVYERCCAANRALGVPPGESGLRAQLDHFESFLLRRLRRRDAAPDAWVARFVAELEAGAPLGNIVDASGISHRAFITRFHRAVGLTPKVYSRVRRFQRGVEALAAAQRAFPRREPGISLARLAADLGYADQAHFSREFAGFSGVSPTNYLRLAPLAPNHVPVRLERPRKSAV